MVVRDGDGADMRSMLMTLWVDEGRDALSYGAFFGAYDCAVRYLTPRDTFPAMIGGGAAGNYDDDDGT